MPRASRGRSLDQRLEESQRVELLKTMGVEIWRRRESTIASSSIGAASEGVAEGRSGNSNVGAASAGGASAAMAAEPGAAASAEPAIEEPSAPPAPETSRQPTVPALAQGAPQCELHAYKYDRVLVLADPAEISQENRRMLQDLVRAMGGDPEKHTDPREFLWPPAEGALFEEGQDAALTAFVDRLKGKTADAVLLCIGDSAKESVQGLALELRIVYAGALRSLRASDEAKRNLWQRLRYQFFQKEKQIQFFTGSLEKLEEHCQDLLREGTGHHTNILLEPSEKEVFM